MDHLQNWLSCNLFQHPLNHPAPHTKNQNDEEQAAAAGSRMRRKTAKILAAARSRNNYLTTKALNSPCNSE
jgi:hypothetical protein